MKYLVIQFFIKLDQIVNFFGMIRKKVNYFI